MPSIGKLKTKILNNDPHLRQLFNCNCYTLAILKKYMAHVRLFYTFERRREELIKKILKYEQSSERIFYFDGEQLFLSLEVYNMEDKISSSKIIFTQWDLEELFQIRFTN